MEPLEKSQNQQLAEYIRKNLAKGYTIDSLRYALIGQGYSRTSVEKAIETANKQLASTAPRMQEKPVITYTYDDEDMKKKVAEQDSAKQGLFKKLWKKILS